MGRFTKIAYATWLSLLSFGGNKESYCIPHQYQDGVSSLGILYDKGNKLSLLIDTKLQNKKLPCHPYENTIAIQYDDLIKFTKYTHLSFLIIKKNYFHSYNPHGINNIKYLTWYFIPISKK